MMHGTMSLKKWGGGAEFPSLKKSMNLFNAKRNNLILKNISRPVSDEHVAATV